jgi:hypothetical protein
MAEEDIASLLLLVFLSVLGDSNSISASFDIPSAYSKLGRNIWENEYIHSDFD